MADATHKTWLKTKKVLKIYSKATIKTLIMVHLAVWTFYLFYFAILKAAHPNQKANKNLPGEKVEMWILKYALPITTAIVWLAAIPYTSVKLHAIDEAAKRPTARNNLSTDDRSFELPGLSSRAAGPARSNFSLPRPTFAAPAPPYTPTYEVPLVPPPPAYTPMVPKATTKR
ncbi:hypothetical protein BT63DRAFT_461444 [Microthyrium microscopicum]|uniref:Uncharacterized protein n=1 Tax=Microthyrium microscopicum TaxID=703497 RepID=A0A6A6TTE9_9PEZI|nr:hypothetical protein BT63DRAFT_461444 [Microthyrium microscopicum]